MNVLVTGGAGYIGSAVVEELLAEGHTPVVLDSLVAGHREAVPNDVPFIEGDMADRALVGQTLRNYAIEAVIHMAAFLQPNESMSDPGKYFENNVAKTISLLQSMVENGVKRFIFSSSCATFGNPVYLPIDEKHPQQPISPYGQSKLMVEQLLPWYEQAHGLRSCCLRYFNACGATASRGEDHDPEIHLIPLILQVAAGKRSHIKIYGTDYDTPDGSPIRDYIHISDLGRAHVLALKPLAERSQNYNLANGAGFSVREVIEAARQVTGREIQVVEAERRAGDPPVMIGDSSLIRAELGWEPRYADLKSIIASAWEWHQKHPQGYASTSHPKSN